MVLKIQGSTIHKNFFELNLTISNLLMASFSRVPTQWFFHSSKKIRNNVTFEFNLA